MLISARLEAGMKWLAIATVIGSLMACGGGSSSPTAPTGAAREHRGPLQRDHHRSINLFCERAKRPCLISSRP